MLANLPGPLFIPHTGGLLRTLFDLYDILDLAAENLGLQPIRIVDCCRLFGSRRAKSLQPLDPLVQTLLGFVRTALTVMNQGQPEPI